VSLFVHADAILSPCGLYRYMLTRTWDESLAPIVWVMLNPSSADATKDDPTVRRCVRFAADWGHGGIIVVNLFARRATNPDELARHRKGDALEDDKNNQAIMHVAWGRRVICAWGAHPAARLRGLYGPRHEEVLALFKGRKLECLGVTKGGQPRHPLYVPATTKPVPFPEE